MSTIITATTGVCTGCGAAVERELATGPAADALNRIPFRCGSCDDALDAELEREARDAADQARADSAARRIANELPPALQHVDLAQLDPTNCQPAIDVARTWAARGGALLFTGPFGVGKTTIAAGALRSRLLAGRPGNWVAAPLLMARLGSGFGSPQREAAVRVLTGRGALVLDDLDKTRPTEYGAEQIFLAVDGAVTNRRPLIATTNLTLGELAQRWPEPYGEAIASRLTGYCTVIRVGGPDRRLAAAGARS